MAKKNKEPALSPLAQRACSSAERYGLDAVRVALVRLAATCRSLAATDQPSHSTAFLKQVLQMHLQEHALLKALSFTKFELEESIAADRAASRRSKRPLPVSGATQLKQSRRK